MNLIIANHFNDLKSNEVLVSPLNGDDIFLLPDIAPSECESITCFLVDSIPLKVIREVLLNYVSKLRHGGTIKLVGTDLNQVLLAYLNRRIDIIEINQLLYGGPEIENSKNGCYVNSDISAILQGTGIKIIGKRIVGTQYIVEGCRD